MTSTPDPKPPLSEYKPINDGWQRIEGLEPDEIEQRGKIALILVAVVILALAIAFKVMD